MKNTNRLLFCFAIFSATAFLFSCGGGANEKTPGKVLWFSLDSSIAGENYHYNDSIDSLVSTTFIDKNRIRKKHFEIQKNIHNRTIYRYSIDFDSAGRKRAENYFDMRTTNSISRFFDKSGNLYHESITFFNESFGDENLMVDYDNHIVSNVFLSSQGFYQKQEYDSLGKIRTLTKPYRVEGATEDSTRFILFLTEKDKAAFKDTLYEHVNKLEGELKMPMKM